MVREDLTKIMQDRFHKEIREADDKEIYLALMSYTKEKLKELPEITGERKLYYISAEFLIGKLLSNNLINLGIYEEVAEVLRENGKSLSAIEAVSYTHLDVYKRQADRTSGGERSGDPGI